MSEPNTAVVAPDLLDIDEVCKFFGGSRPLNPATIYRGAGVRYPKPIKIAGNTNRWLRADCEAALRRMVEARGTALEPAALVYAR